MAIDNAMLPDSYRVVQRLQETHDIFSLYLEPAQQPAANVAPFSFLPGQFNMLYVFGAGEVPISISGASSAAGPIVHTVRSVGSITAMLENLQVGAQLGVRGPYGSCWPIQQAKGKDVVLIAGGIGLAPLRPVLYHLLEHRDDYGEIVVLYGTRSPQDILFEQELHQWKASFNLQVEVTVDRADRHWHGNVGVVTSLLPQLRFDPDNTIAMNCGPEIMMRFAVQELVKRGVAEEYIFLSMERNMKCAVGLCGHCQIGPSFVCKDGAVYPFPAIKDWFYKKEA